MGCSVTLNGIANDCTPNLGGIKKAYIANFADVTSVSVDETTGFIKTITMADGAKFKPFEFRKNTGSFTETLTKDDTNGSSYVATEITLVFAKRETAKRIEVSALSLGQLAVIIEDANGKYWYFGYDEYVSASGGESGSGTAKADANAYTVTLATESADYAYEVQASAVEAVI